MFSDNTKFDFSFLENLKGLIEDEHQRLENELIIDSEAFNYSNCQCQTEYYEYVQEKELKKLFKEDLTYLVMN